MRSFFDSFFDFDGLAGLAPASILKPIFRFFFAAFFFATRYTTGAPFQPTVS